MEAILPQSRGSERKRNTQNAKTNMSQAHDNVTDIGELCLHDVEVQSMDNDQLGDSDQVTTQETNSTSPM